MTSQQQQSFDQEKHRKSNLDEQQQDDDDEIDGVPMDFLKSYGAVRHKKYDPKNPSLFSETYAMSLTAAAIFSFADVRRAARNGVIDAPEAIGLPLRVDKALQVYAQHKEALAKVMKKADMLFLNTLLQNIQDEATFDGFCMSYIIQHAIIHYFGDDDSKSECVYLLLENAALSRLVLCFRGSITMNDWIKDSKAVLGNIKNPLFMRPDQPHEIGVHLGFREYLYDERRNISLRLPPVKERIEAVRKTARELPDNISSKLRLNITSSEEQPSISADKVVERNANLASVNEENKKENSDTTIIATEDNATPPRPDTTTSGSGIKTSRITQILEQVNSLRSKNKDSRIYVTGHSLGGALALLTALEVAAHWGTKSNPVTYIGIGNPRAATYSFRNAVETLEQEGKMRCLGVHNHLDIVPMIPTSALHVRTKNNFCQVGFQMLLHPDKFEMRYCPRTNNTCQDFKDQAERMALAIFRPDKIAGRHHYMTYLSYLRSLEEALSRLHLNDYYNDAVGFDIFEGSEPIYALSPSHVGAKRNRDRRCFCFGKSEDENNDSP
jgi:pimeloyl-ACP methyl ester carboxylesterase